MANTSNVDKKTPQLSSRDRKEIERLTRKHGRETVVATSLNTDLHTRRGRPSFWDTETVVYLCDLADAIYEIPELRAGRSLADILKDDVAKPLREKHAGIPTLLAADKPEISEAAKSIGAQENESISRQLRRQRKRT